jgi:dethiobiotin synthetase
VLVLVAGTGTDIGKTWLTARVATALRARNVAVRARKPAQSFAPGDASTDAHVLGSATGEDAEVVCPPARWYPIPMAPPMAADALGRPAFTIADLVADLPGGPNEGIVFVESAGGVRSPIADDGDTAALAAALAPDVVVLVADAGLGTINAVRSSIDGLLVHETRVFLNHYDAGDDLHRRNREWLIAREGLEVETEPEALAAFLADRARVSR